MITMKHYLSFGKKPTGRPPVIELSATDLDEISAHYVAGTNHSKSEGSMLLAWVRFCEERPEKFGHLVCDHMPATTIPTAVVEACRKRRAIIGAYRGGASRQRHEGAYVPGTMRRHHAMERRLWAGERASVDDATRNVACTIPWPWGGCPCSDKFGVRLGRWQTLIVHDDASSFVPFISSVFRWEQSYRATDAASVILRAETSVCQWDHWSIEGGVWQAKRTLAILAGRFISAKGRPNQKLVENYIGRLWGIMAEQSGDVGRHRGEMKSASDLYIRCRQGREDPRKHFMSLTPAQEQLYTAVEYLNEKRIRSRTYGEWVPKSRWESDMEEAPHPLRNVAEDFLIMPAAETRKVRSGMFKLTMDGPQGIPMVWTFAADWLYQYEGRHVTAYFDPMAAWPVTATITLQGDRKPLGTVECINTIGESKDRAAEIVKSIRQTMMSETRVIATRFTERQIRHNQGVIVTTSGAPASAPIENAGPSAEEIETRWNAAKPAVEWGSDLRLGTAPRDPREAAAPAPRATREDVSNSLARRARLAREGREEITLS
jgi:hypothetical protein